MADDAPRLAATAAAIDLDPGVLDAFDGAWDAAGALSAERWPELGALRQRIEALQGRIRATLDALVHGDALADDLQDRFWTLREGRYVLPLKPHAKHRGIVHGTSRTGQTVFVEPETVVSLNNALRVAEGALAAAEHRVRAELSRALGTAERAVRDGISAAVHLDLVASRAGLALAVQGTRPRVGADGVVALRGARHPVLALRGVAVVPNDLDLAADRPALVVSGPNAGGKTVALKTVGLCALLVQHGCFVPAEPGSRVDRFHAVVATIGDLQTIHRDLSSFSGHLLALRRILDRVRPGTLVLLDEVASGTDPAQGAALAQAVSEAVLDRGGRLVLTTHFARLKGLAEADPRFAAAAAEVVDGAPTFRLLPGTTGDSHAFELARRMGLDPAVLARAEALVDPGEAELDRALRRLEAERARARALSRELDALRAQAAAREEALAAREARIRERSRALEAEGARAYLDRLRQAERAVAAVVADLQRNPSHRAVRAARASLDALRALAPDDPASNTAPDEVEVGDRVRVRDGPVGEVTAVGPRQVKVRVGAMTLTVRPSDLAPTREAPARPKRPAPSRPPAPPPPVAVDRVVRTPSNTLDLRGRRLDESTDLAERFFDRALLAGHDAVFLLHGHGTGRLKAGLRAWLRDCDLVRAWAPATEEQGGDAFTVVAVGAARSRA